MRATSAFRRIPLASFGAWFSPGVALAMLGGIALFAVVFPTLSMRETQVALFAALAGSVSLFGAAYRLSGRSPRRARQVSTGATGLAVFFLLFGVLMFRSWPAVASFDAQRDAGVYRLFELAFTNPGDAFTAATRFDLRDASGAAGASCELAPLRQEGGKLVVLGTGCAPATALSPVLLRSTTAIDRERIDYAFYRVEFESTRELAFVRDGYDFVNVGSATGCRTSLIEKGVSGLGITVRVDGCSADGSVELRLVRSSLAGDWSDGPLIERGVSRRLPVYGADGPLGVAEGTSRELLHLAHDLRFRSGSIGEIRGVEPRDFANSGDATGCRFFPLGTSGTSITVLVADCAPGTIRPIVRAGSVSDAGGEGPIADAP
jgi:hypothetical protein